MPYERYRVRDTARPPLKSEGHPHGRRNLHRNCLTQCSLVLTVYTVLKTFLEWHTYIDNETVLVSSWPPLDSVCTTTNNCASLYHASFTVRFLIASRPQQPFDGMIQRHRKAARGEHKRTTDLPPRNASYTLPATRTLPSGQFLSTY